MKILVLQPNILRSYPTKFRLEINNYVTNFLLKRNYFDNEFYNKVIKNFFSQTKFPITSELAHYGDLTKVLGSENVFSIDRYNPYVFEKNFSKSVNFDWENYPTAYGYQAPTFIKSNHIFDIVKKVNIVLASIKYGSNLNEILKFAKKRGVFIALFDNIDHENIYLNKSEDPYRGFKEEEFDVYFKKDIPLELRNDKLIPIAPVPTKFEEQDAGKLVWEDRTTTIYFKGAYRKNITRSDRLEICQLLKNKFPSTSINLNENHISESKYRIEAQNSKILLSPAGRVWCSYRHTNLAKYNVPLLLPRPNCKTVSNDFLFDDDAIYYDTALKYGKFEIKNFERLQKKIKEVISESKLANEMSRNMYEKIMSKHTTLARSQYIINKIKSLL